MSFGFSFICLVFFYFFRCRHHHNCMNATWQICPCCFATEGGEILLHLRSRGVAGKNRTGKKKGFIWSIYFHFVCSYYLCFFVCVCVCVCVCLYSWFVSSLSRQSSGGEIETSSAVKWTSLICLLMFVVAYGFRCDYFSLNVAQPCNAGPCALFYWRVLFCFCF